MISGFWEFLGGAAFFLTAAAFLTKELVKHLLEKDRKQHEQELKAVADRSLRQFELATNAETNTALEKLKKDLQLDIAAATRAAEAETARDERIRAEVLRWANPILGAVRDLKSRLGNILKDDAHPALHKQPKQAIPAGWSIGYDYFMPSTLYLFCQYFYWVRRFRLELSFEIFHSQENMDALRKHLDAVGEPLGKWPFGSACSGNDVQVFALQQRALSDAVTVRSDGSRVMGYDEFLAQWQQPGLAVHLAPLRALLEDLDDPESCRWKRLEAAFGALEALEKHCVSVLQPPLATPRPPVQNPA